MREKRTQGPGYSLGVAESRCQVGLGRYSHYLRQGRRRRRRNRLTHCRHRHIIAYQCTPVNGMRLLRQSQNP